MRKNRWVFTLIVFSLLLLAACGESNDSSHKENADHDKSNDTPLKVVIDPGHGGVDVGATGVSGQHEKDFTLNVSKKVEKLLEQEPNIQVFMTRVDDQFISQESRQRPNYANEIEADLFISIHGNTFSDPNVSGTETFYYHKHSQHFAEIMQKHVVDATGFRDRGALKKDLFVVKDTKMPAALIEIGYLTNPQDESDMWDEDFQNRVADAIVEGIKEYQDRAL